MKKKPARSTKTRKGVRLATALRPNSTLHQALKPGIQAFTDAHRDHILPGDRSKLGDSIDLDEACRVEYPQANRWDYIFSAPELNKLLALEPHSPKDSEVGVLIAKREHARMYLRSHLQTPHKVSHWFWVSDGKVRFSQMDRIRRILDQNGIVWAGRCLKALKSYQ